MAVPLQASVDLLIAEALRQVNQLESQLERLAQPISIPVNIDQQGAAALEREMADADDSVEALNRELAQTDDALRDAGQAARRTGDDLDTAGRKGTSAFRSMAVGAAGLAAAFVAVQGARAAFDFAGEAINQASELEQSIGALDAVFGSLGATVAEFGETADQSVGLAASQFNQLASLLGSQLQTFGFNVSDAATETQRLIGLASDLAATFGGPVSQAVEAISSLLRGETNPIERYGVAMNVAIVNAKALELGLAATTTELTLQDQTLARLAILTEQTANAQGQFAREAETTAGQLERIRAQFTNFQAEAGEALVPAFQKILDLLPGIIDQLENSLIPAIAGFGEAISDVDFSSFLTFLAGIPSAGSTLVSFVDSGAQAVGNAFQVFNALATLDFSDLGVQFQQLGDDLSDISDSAAANTAIQTLIKTLATGRDPAAALESTLNELGKTVSSMEVDDFEDLAEQLLAMAVAAGADPGDLVDLAFKVGELGEAAGYSAAGVEILTRLLIGPWGDAMAAASTGPIIEGVFATELENTGQAAWSAVPGLDAFRVAAEDLDFSDATAGLADFRSDFARLPAGLDAAAEALRNKEGEIISDFTRFLKDLETELATQQAFNANIAILENMGLDALADFFREEGLDAAKALADAVANPEEARRAEALLDDYARDQVRTFHQAFLNEINQLDLEIPVRVRLIREQFGLAGQFNDAGEIVVRDSGGQGQVVNQVTQNFYTQPAPTTETARAGQAVAAVTRAGATRS